MKNFYSRRTTLAFYALLILSAVGLAALVWINSSVVSEFPSGEYFSIAWGAGRGFLTDGTSPYSSSASAEIQRDVAERGYPVDSALHRFIFPIYLLAPMLPFLLVPQFSTAAVLWMLLLEIALILIAYFGVKVQQWRVTAPMAVLVVGWVLFNYISVSQVYQGSIIIFVALLVVLAFAAIQRELDELAGIALALATIKPGPILLVVLFVVFWAASNRRWKLIVWALGAWILLAAGGLFFINDWPIQYVRLLLDPSPTRYFQSPQASFLSNWPGLGRQLGWILAGVLVLLLIFEWWMARRKDFRWFIWTASLTLAVTPWIGIPTEPGYQVLLIFPLLLVWSKLDEHWGNRIQSFIIAMMIFIFAGLWLLFGWDLPNTFITRQYPVLFLPLPLITIIGLYWVKWWAVRKRSTFISDLKAREEF